jgi:hypothetical protein
MRLAPTVPAGELIAGLTASRRFAAHDIGERGRVARADLEAEVGRVEVDGAFDVVDHVADVHELVRHVPSPPGGQHGRVELAPFEARSGRLPAAR